MDKKAFKAETAIHRKGDKKACGIRVDSKFRVTGPKRLVKAYHGRLKRQLNLENYHYRGFGKRHNNACIILRPTRF